MSGSNPSSTAVWAWTPTITPKLQRNIRIVVLGLIAVIAVSAGLAIATPGRFVIVVTVGLAGLGIVWVLEHRQFSSTKVAVDSSGVLTITDGRSTESIDLARVDSVTVRLRTQAGGPIPRWTIELLGPDVTLVRSIAHAAGLFNPDTADIEFLERGLVEQVERASGRRISTTQQSGASTPASTDLAPPSMTSAGALNGPAAGSLAAPIGEFEWRPRVSPTADRRRRWYRIAYVGAALLVAVLAASSVWGDWVAVMLSALTVPGLILLFCGGLDYAIGRARRFRLFTENGVLHVDRGRTPRRIELRGATVVVDRQSHVTGSSTATTRTTQWMLTINAADGTALLQALPGFGTTTSEADYVELERELRRRT